ncbi:ATP-binding protein [Apilactobacillus xinyiensis]|uniref:ATP-binding protein n=1 Tax=Apilactobacillus xinyiensis TaxID=2841032 RepID=UPI003365259A
MLIKQLKIFGYGKWQDDDIILKSDKLNVIFGNNESGKTTLVSFIKGILFGFKDGHNTYEQYIPKNTKSYGGELLVDIDGQLFILKRIAGAHGGELSIIKNDSGDKVSNDYLKNILGPINRDAFDNIFYFGNFDTKAFSKVSDEQLAYIIQKVGFAGSEKFIQLKDDLVKRNKKIYAKTGRKPLLNKKLKEYESLLDRINQAKLKQNDYTNLENSLNHVKLEYNRANDEFKSVSANLNQLQNFKNNWNLCQKLKKYNDLKKINLPSGFDEEDKIVLDNIYNQLNNLNDKIKNLEDQLNVNDNVKLTKQNNDFNKAYDDIEKFKSRLDLIEKNIIEYNSNIHNLNSLKKQIAIYKKDYAQNLNSKPLNDVQISEIKSLLKSKSDLLTQTSKKDPKSVFTLKNNYLYSLLLICAILMMAAGLFTNLLISAIGSVLLVFSGFKMLYDNHNLSLQAEQELSQQLNDVNIKLEFYKKQFNYESDNPNDWIMLQPNLKNYNKILTNYNHLKIEVDTLLKTLNTYFDNFNKITHVTDSEDSYSDKLLKVKSYINKNEHEIYLYQNNANQNNALVSKQKQLTSKITEIKHTLNAFFKNRNIKNRNEFNEEYARQLKIKQEMNDLSQINQQISEELYFSINKYDSLTTLNNEYSDVNAKLNSLQKTILNLTKQKTELQSQISLLKADGTYLELVQQKANLESEIIHLTKNWLSLELSNQWIDKMLDLATADLIPNIKSRAQEYFSILTNANYINITYYKSKLKLTRFDKIKFDVGELSRGTMQQLYFAILLSMAVGFSQKYNLPILIDDGFYEYDNNRYNQAMKLINEVSKDVQVIYLTADSSVKDYFDSQSIIEIK